MSKSILQENREICFLCGGAGGYDPLDRHHVFGGALRKKSEKYGLVVYLHHHSCHIFGPRAVHRNRENALWLQRRAQRAAMERYGWSVEDFRREFYKNYL